ncbi:YbeD family protein [Aminobacter niigataensis]|uniref:hypothetical protein n=1 Tax=Aminobacter niigataensis TaxID=83265 RepID=UPI0024CC7756|nr:hypothetical protein [Aminobacter niigataensis]CAI2935042.1 conserved protein of unknown function [Aminobacter niigataensis]
MSDMISVAAAYRRHGYSADQRELRRQAATAWSGWRVYVAGFEPDLVDGATELKVFASRFPSEGGNDLGLTFLIGRGNSERLDALTRAVGLERLDHPRQLEGRYFSVRDGGRTAADFAPLDRAISQ